MHNFHGIKVSKKTFNQISKTKSPQRIKAQDLAMYLLDTSLYFDLTIVVCMKQIWTLYSGWPNQTPGLKHNSVMVTASSRQWYCYNRNNGNVTSKIIYLYYRKLDLLNQSIPKIKYLILQKTTTLLPSHYHTTVLLDMRNALKYVVCMTHNNWPHCCRIQINSQ